MVGPGNFRGLQSDTRQTEDRIQKQGDRLDIFNLLFFLLIASAPLEMRKTQIRRQIGIRLPALSDNLTLAGFVTNFQKKGLSAGLKTGL